MAAIDDLKTVDIVFSGRLITAVDASLIPEGCFQTCKNLRYGIANPVGVSGMTARSSTVLSQLNIDSAIHFKRDFDNETHVLVHAFDANDANGKIYQNTTAIGTTGDFAASALWSDATAASRGRFSIAPDDSLVYCNRRENAIFDGTLCRVGAFVNYDPDNISKLWDYTEDLSDPTHGTSDAVVLNTSTNTLDAYTKLLLHLDNATTDSSSAPHTMTATAITFLASAWPLNDITHVAIFNGTTSKITTPDHADFNFAAGTFTLEAWVKPTAISGIQPILCQFTDGNNYVVLQISATGALEFKIIAAGLPVVSLASPAGAIVTTSWSHIAIVEDDNKWYLFVNRTLVDSATDTDRAANYTSTWYIGTDSSNYFAGNMSEVRVSNGIARWTSNFRLLRYKYGGTNNAYVMVGSIRPIAGLKCYVGTANTNTGTVSVSYWDGSNHVACSNISDGTLTAGKTLAKTGLITFDDTATLAKPSYFNGNYAYWYMVTFANISTTTSLYYVSLKRNMQTIKDLWDGVFRLIGNLETEVSGVINDVTKNVIYDEWAYGDEATYVNVGGITATDALYFGFTEQMTGLKLGIVKDNINTTADTVASIYYWTGSAWALCQAINDATFNNNASLGRSGVITWQHISNTSERKRVINAETNVSLYYYKVVFSKTLSADTYIYFAAGITAPKTIDKYSFPTIWQNRVVLCGNLSHGANKILIGALGTTSTFNGSDSIELEIGDRATLPVAAGALYMTIGDSIYDALLVAKTHSIYLVTGTSPADFIRKKLSGVYGCTAPETFQVCDLGFEDTGITKRVIIWQSSNAIVMFDGSDIIEISADVANFFDPSASDHLNFDRIQKASAFYDTRYKEYHWLFSSGTNTTLDREFVYSLTHKKWFEIDRSTKKLICGFGVSNTYDNHYTYGVSQDGYLEQLEQGTTFDGVSIPYTLKTGDKPISGYPMSYETQIRFIKMLMKAKSTTTQSVTCTHFSNTATSADSTTATFDPTDPAHRLAGYKSPVPVQWDAILHSFNLTVTTSDETVGFEPLGISLLIKPIRQNLK